MARNTKSPTTDINQVRIPAELLHALGAVFTALHGRIVESAALEALAGKCDGRPLVVSAENILHAAQGVFETAPGILQQALKRRETRYARRAS